MTRRIFARLSNDPEGPVSAVVSGEKPEAIADLSSFRLKAKDQIVVFVPGTDVSALKAPIPARNEREARRAAAFAIEDDVATPVEALHVALSSKQGEAERDILVCSNEQMTAWLARMEQLGVSEAILVPEFAVLPAQDCAVDLGERIAMRINGRPLSIDRDAPDDLLQALVSASSLGPVRIMGDALAARLGGVGAESVSADPLIDLAALAEVHGIGVDLRQGAFAPQRSLTVPDMGTWRMPALIAAAAGLAWLGGLSLETSRLNTVSAEMRAEAQAAYSNAFPEERQTGNPAARIQEKLAGSGPRTLDFEAVTAVVYDALEQLNGASLRSLRFDREQGILRLGVDYGAYGDDIRLVELLAASGLDADLGDTRNRGNIISGELTLGGAS